MPTTTVKREDPYRQYRIQRRKNRMVDMIFGTIHKILILYYYRTTQGMSEKHDFLPQATLPPAFPVVLLSSCPPIQQYQEHQSVVNQKDIECFNIQFKNIYDML